MSGIAKRRELIYINKKKISINKSIQEVSFKALISNIPF